MPCISLHQSLLPFIPRSIQHYRYLESNVTSISIAESDSRMTPSLDQSNATDRDKPSGRRFIDKFRPSSLSYEACQALVLALTFVAYACYHATRKTASVVKTELDPGARSQGLKLLQWRSPATSTGWAPFNGDNGTELLGMLDVAFLAVYAFGMYFSGHIGDRMDLRIFLTIGMVGTAVFTSLFGVGYWLNIHSFYFYLTVQILAGLFQSTGWPTVVAIMGNWLGKRKRGLVMGIWNAHTSCGNITGSLIASAMLGFGWGWSLVVPGLIMLAVGLVVFVFLPVTTSGFDIGEEDEKEVTGKMTEPLLQTETAVGFLEAWKIPGVAPFALCLFFAKLVAYTFLYWLPFYITHTAIDGKYLSSIDAGNLSTLFDVGGVLGGVLAGHVSDYLDARAITAASFMYCSIPVLYLYRTYGEVSMGMNIGLMVLTGMLVNGPYSLITTAVSADLGTHESLKGNSKALATVTAIIDGTGSLGAAVGPLLTGYISANSWSAVFMMLMGAAFVAGLLLTRLVVAELSGAIATSRRSRLVGERLV